MTAWVTEAETSALLGIEFAISDTYLNQAAAVIEGYINREVEDIPDISARDLRRIQKAIAWQAYYMQDQPDFNYLALVESASTDGQSFQMAKNGTNGSVFEAAQVLHPVAIRYLRNLSWKNGHLNLAPAPVLNDSFLNESSDDSHLWRELS